jgi:hypothetical protein
MPDESALFGRRHSITPSDYTRFPRSIELLAEIRQKQLNVLRDRAPALPPGTREVLQAAALL